jgi:hypothetical protein
MEIWVMAHWHWSVVAEALFSLEHSSSLAMPYSYKQWQIRQNPQYLRL